MTSSQAQSPEGPRPLASSNGDGASVTPATGISLARGHASPEELAALVAVLSAASAEEVEPAPRHTSQWASRERMVRRPLAPGPGAWRASSWPR